MVHDFAVIESGVDAPGILTADQLINVDRHGLRRLDHEVVKDRSIPEGTSVIRCGNDAGTGSKAADISYFGLPLKARGQRIRAALGNSRDCRVLPALLYGIAGLDERHKVLHEIVDALVVIGTHLLVRHAVLLRQRSCIHICPHDDHGDCEPVVQHLSIQRLQDGSFVHVGIVSPAKTVKHIEDRILLRRNISCREQNIAVLVIARSVGVVFHVGLDCAIVDVIVPFLKFCGDCVIGFHGIGGRQRVGIFCTCRG